MDKIESKQMPHFKKGDAFVESTPYPLVFMEVNEVEVGPGDKDFCIVTWYSLNESGLNAQRRFPMVAVDGGFCNFEPISRRLLKEVKSLMRQFDVEAKQLTDKKEAKSLLREYTCKLIELLPDAEERLTITAQEAKEIVTDKWLDCTDDNYTGWKKILTSMTCTLHLSVTLLNHTMMRITKTLLYNFSICMMTARMAGIRLQKVGPSIW